MKVLVGKKTYSMSQSKYKGLLGVAKEQVKKGIYAIEKSGYAELRCDVCKSTTQLKAMKQQYKQQGYKVYANG